MRQHVVVVALLLVLAACQKTGPAPQAASVVAGDPNFAATLQERLLDAKPGDVIEIPAGKFSFDRSLSLRADGVTIRGAGMDTSVKAASCGRSAPANLTRAPRAGALKADCIRRILRRC